jgi:hypothetical protein
MYVVAMLVRNHNRLYVVHGQAQPFHPFFGLPAGDATVYKYGFISRADVITVTIATRVE